MHLDYVVRFVSKGIAAADLSSHKSERDTWRYIQASEDEMEETLESVTDALNGSAQLTEDTPSMVISAIRVRDSGRFVLSHLARCGVQRSDGSYQSLANFTLSFIGATRASLL